MLMQRPRPQYNRHRARKGTGSGLWVASGPQFTSPTQIAGLIGWYDFSDGGYVTTSGSDITGITDKSTQAANLSDGGGTNKFQYGVVTQNGLNTASNSSAASCYLTSASNAYGAPGSYTIFIAAMTTGAVGQSKNIVGGQFTTTGGFSLYRNNGTTRFQTFENVGSAGANSGGGCVNNVWNVLEFDCATGSGQTARYGVDTGSGSAGWPSRNLSTIILGSGGTDAILGAVGEVIIYNSRLGTTNRNKVQNWLKSKWNF